VTPQITKIALLSVIALSSIHSARAQAPAPDGSRTFEGTWSATGQRQALPTEANRPAAVIYLSGAVVLTGATGLSSGFRGEAIGFDDGRALNAGRAVWTDARGDQVFSELKGEPLQTGKRIFGTITGGTGRYARATGDYELTWQYIVAPEDGTVQGRASDLHGRFRLSEAGR